MPTALQPVKTATPNTKNLIIDEPTPERGRTAQQDVVPGWPHGSNGREARRPAQPMATAAAANLELAIHVATRNVIDVEIFGPID